MNATLRIEIFPADIDVSLDFYTRLGFSVRGRNDGPPRYASVVLDAVRIGMAEAEPVDPKQRAYPAMTEIVIEVDDVHGLHAQVQARGIPISEGLRHREWGLTDFRVTDPDGYYLRFTSRTEC